MIIESARLTIDPARAESFESAVAECAPMFRAARGCRWMALEREVEDVSHYVLRVGWDSIEDHMVGFRNSPAYQSWRAAAGLFFVEPPVVVHHRTTLHPF